MKINHLDEEQKYNSLVDEYNRYKRIYKKIKFNENNIDHLWNAFLIAFKKTFHIKKELLIGLEFGLKIQDIHSIYTIKKLDHEKKELMMSWKNKEDKYWLTFYFKKRWLIKKYVLKIRNEIKKETTFYGLQDTAGLIWWKKTFKKQMKIFGQSIKYVLSNELKNS